MKRKGFQLLVSIALLLLIFSLLGVCYYFGYQSAKLSSPAPSSSVVVSPTPVPPIHKYTTYIDPRVEKLEVTYDEDVWTLDVLNQKSSKTIGKNQYIGPGILFEQKDGLGVLNINFTLAFGVGGGITLFSSNESKILKNGWARIDKYSKSSYGRTNVLVFYRQQPDLLLSDKNECIKWSSKSAEGMPLFDLSECPRMLGDELIGFAPQPAFSRSPRFKQAVPMNDIYAEWTNDDYVVKNKINDGYMIAEITYYGSSPEKADKVIESISSLGE